MRGDSPDDPPHGYACLDGLYALHDELGCGGFGKVKLATHLLTGQRVAIKIIDKKAIGHDLPRVKTEMDALRTLSHQNICRLYQYIETDEKFFIVMEYCSGGEMFDYIVRKERLEESEARHFFRQLVVAMVFVHTKGYAHRDLKPENLLLTDDLQLKVIDFGLCAKPGHMNAPLETCCGSPAYAAPELIQGNAYLGHEADVWSMGVLLYALLCGSLPFEDDNMQLLYRKITKGEYHEPNFLSPGSREVLKLMIKIKPKERIKLQELVYHPWMNHRYSQPIKWESIYDKNIVDEDVATELAHHHGRSVGEMIKIIKLWNFDYLTATYYLLLQQKRKGMKICLPAFRYKSNGDHNIIASPTIHASLDRNLDRSGVEEDSSDTSEHSSRLSSEDSSDCSSGREVRFTRPLSPERDKKASYITAMNNMPAICTGRSPQQRLFDSPSATPPRHRTIARPQVSLGFDQNYLGYSENKENVRGTMSVRVRGPVKVSQEDYFCGGAGTRPRSIYSTPQRKTIRGMFSPKRAQSQERTPCSPMSLDDGPSYEDVGTNCELASTRTPRSATKQTPRLRQRVYASLERNKDRVINLLTPRKVKNDPQVLKTAGKEMVNVSVTSSKDASAVRENLINVFTRQNIKFEVNGWKISGKQSDHLGHSMTVQLEVVVVESLNAIGIRRKRLNGDAFLYKKVCEQILLMANIDNPDEKKK